MRIFLRNFLHIYNFLYMWGNMHLKGFKRFSKNANISMIIWREKRFFCTNIFSVIHRIFMNAQKSLQSQREFQGNNISRKIDKSTHNTNENHGLYVCIWCIERISYTTWNTIRTICNLYSLKASFLLIITYEYRLRI